MNNIIGVLALQGAYQKHVNKLSMLGVKSRLVRKKSDLENCDALILPGGESTTINLLLQENNFHSAIRQFASTQAVMGVCAGMILMATEVNDETLTPLMLLPFKALRNFYGRQTHSFTADIKLNFDQRFFCAPFIRAPGIKNISPEITVLATLNNTAVMIGMGRHIALSFHPELTHDTRIHEYWLRKI